MKYMHVSITFSSNPNSIVNGAYVYYSDDKLGLELANHVSVKEGMIALRKLEKLLGRPAEMKVNPYQSTISYKELYGILDGE